MNSYEVTFRYVVDAESTDDALDAFVLMATDPDGLRDGAIVELIAEDVE